MKIPFLYNLERVMRRVKDKIKKFTSEKHHYSEIRKKQNLLFKSNFNNTKKMIVFVNFADNDFCGGIMTIFNFADISRQMKDIHGCEVIHANFFNNEGRCYLSQDKFKNDETIYRLEQVMEKASELDKLIIHIPELMIKDFTENVNKYRDKLKKVKDLQINILNQNEEVFPEPRKWKSLWEITNNITQTTGFDKYTTQEICDYYQLPLYRLLGYNGLHEKYGKTSINQKEKIIFYSPDPHPMKLEILESVKQSLPEYQFIEVSDITFDEFMQLCQKAKYSITFGEGFDGYFTTIHLVGGLGFTVYNKTFFPCEDFLKHKTVYNSYEELKDKIVQDIRYFDENDDGYISTSKEVCELNVSKTYNKQLTYDLMEKFYLKEPTFIPNEKKRPDYSYKNRVTHSQVAIEKTESRKDV